MKKRNLLILAGIIPAVLLAGCGKSGGDEKEKKDTKVVADSQETESKTSSKDEEKTEAAENKKGAGEVIVYNWGEYLDPDTLELFTEETGI